MSAMIRRVRFLSSDVSGGGDLIPTVLKNVTPAFGLKQRRTRRKQVVLHVDDLMEHPELIRTQFSQARKTSDVELMISVMKALEADSPEGPLRSRITKTMLDEALLYSMINRKLKMAKILINGGADVVGADYMHTQMKGDLGCDCKSHPSMLLVTLARQGNHPMIELCLEGGLDVNASVCDGTTESLSWGIAFTLKSRGHGEQTPVLKSKLSKITPLMAACTNNDLRLVEVLVRRGARVEAYNKAAIAEAAIISDNDHLVLKFFLNRYTSQPDFSENKNVLFMFQEACAVALAAAASRGDDSTVKWIIDKVEDAEDWTFGGVHKERKRTAETSSSQSSDGSSSANSCLKESSMRQYEGRKKSIVIDDMRRQRKKHDMVSYVLQRAMNDLIDDGLTSAPLHHECISRGLESLSSVEHNRFGSTPTVQNRMNDIYTIFVNTLQGEFQSAQTSAISLLKSGLEQYLDGMNTSSSPRRRNNFWGKLKAKVAKRKVPIRRASSDERARALQVAVQGGHSIVVEHILGVFGSEYVVAMPRMLNLAAIHDRDNVMELLLDYCADKDGSLKDALEVAMIHGSVVFAKHAIELGAQLEPETYCEIWASVTGKKDIGKDAIDFLAEHSELQVKAWAGNEVTEVIDAAVSSIDPNVYAVASLFDIQEEYSKFVTPQHLNTIVKNSAGPDSLISWSDLTSILLRCIQMNSDDLNGDLQPVYELAMAESLVDSRVLRQLMDYIEVDHSSSANSWV